MSVFIAYYHGIEKSVCNYQKEIIKKYFDPIVSFWDWFFYVPLKIVICVSAISLLYRWQLTWLVTKTLGKWLHFFLFLSAQVIPTNYACYKTSFSRIKELQGHHSIQFNSKYVILFPFEWRELFLMGPYLWYFFQLPHSDSFHEKFCG